MTTWRTWGRTHACTPARLERPSHEADIRAILADAGRVGRRVKVVGSGHSFTDIACTDGVMVKLDRYDRVLHLDRDAGLVTVEAGITLGKLNAMLAREGLALPNLGDIAYQTVAGATSTANHGTGAGLGNLSTQIAHLTLVLADGSTMHCSPEADPTTFRAAQVGLGALGVVSTVTLRCVPAFRLHALEEPAELDDVLDRLDEHVDGNDHFEFFWFPHTTQVYMKRNNRTDDPLKPYKPVKSFVNDVLLSNVGFGAVCRVGRARPELIPKLMQRVVAGGLGRVRVVEQSHKVFASPRYVRFAEMEYAIPRERAAEAVLGVRSLIAEHGFLVNFPVEVRFVAADDILLSPSHGRETCYVAVHLYRGMDHEPYFRAVEELMTSLGGRPHWGKLHYREAASLRGAYPEWDTFARVRSRLDPRGRFRNAYLDRVLGPVGA